MLFVKREGKALGTGVLNRAELVEYGMHDVSPGLDARRAAISSPSVRTVIRP